MLNSIQVRAFFTYFKKNAPIWLLLLLLLTPFVVASFYLFPFGDDFKRSLDAQHLFDFYGGIKEMLRAWSRWSGRYSHHFIIVFLGDMVNSRGLYALLVLSHMAVYALSFYLLLKQLIKDNRELLSIFLLVALLATYAPLNIPWYEATDIFGLGLSNAFFLLYIHFLLKIWNCTQEKVPHFYLVVFCLVFTIGLYEYTCIASIIATLSFCLVAKIKKHPNYSVFLLLGKIALICGLISLFAPGNFNRRRKMNLSSDTQIEQLSDVMSAWLYISLRAFLHPFYIVLLVVAKWVQERATRTISKEYTALYFFLSLAPILIISLFITLIHAFTDVPIQDPHNKMLPALMVLCSPFVFAFFYFLWETLQIKKRIPLQSGLLIFCYCFFISPNYIQTTQNLITGEFSSFAGEMEARIHTMHESGKGLISFHPLSSCPAPICHGDPIGKEPTTWPNKYIARMYGAEQVTLLSAQKLCDEKNEELQAFLEHDAERANILLPESSYLLELYYGDSSNVTPFLVQQAKKEEKIQSFPLSTKTIYALPIRQGSILEYLIKRYLFLLKDKYSFDSFVVNNFTLQEVSEYHQSLSYEQEGIKQEIFPLFLGKGAIPAEYIYYSFDKKNFYKSQKKQ